MRTKLKLFAVVLAAVILTAGLAAFYIATQQENTNPANSTIHVACIGDSITDGTEYPNDLWMLLGANYTVGNFGVGGATVSLQSEKPYMNQTDFQNAMQFKPNIVIIMLGTNDAFPSRQQYLSNFSSDYKKLVTSFQALSTKPKILLVLPPPIFTADLGPNNTFLVTDVIPQIRQVASDLGLPTVDVYSPLVNHPDYFWDGVHPNGDGAKIIADQIYAAIK